MLMRECAEEFVGVQALEIKEDPQELLKKLDRDGSGSVDSEEMLKYLQGHIDDASALAMEQLMLGHPSGGSTSIGVRTTSATSMKPASASNFEAGVSVIDRETRVSVKSW